MKKKPEEEKETNYYEDVLNAIVQDTSKDKVICDLALAEIDRRAAKEEIQPPKPPEESGYKQPSEE